MIPWLKTRLKPLEKYGSVFAITLQHELYYSASFLMDRARSITIIIAFYAFWTAIFQDRTDLLGYSKSQMMTYILGMNILRALIFSDKTWEIIREINTGKISAYLIRPISYIGYSVSRDAVDKLTNLLSAVVEVALVVWILNVPIYIPKSGSTIFYFLIAVPLALFLYFFMVYAISALAFWTAESAGPRFCFELFLEFASGAFFPLDVLPATLRGIFHALPFASLIYFPLNIFLERISYTQLLQGFLVQGFWMMVLFGTTKWIWYKGMKNYSADGG